MKNRYLTWKPKLLRSPRAWIQAFLRIFFYGNKWLNNNDIHIILHDNISITLDILEISLTLPSIQCMSNDAFNRANARLSVAAEPLPEWLVIVCSQVESLKFGTVQITVHDRKVVQIERNEKTRMDQLH